MVEAPRALREYSLVTTRVRYDNSMTKEKGTKWHEPLRSCNDTAEKTPEMYPDRVEYLCFQALRRSSMLKDEG